MNEAETAAGSSREGEENGDASNESERPLKKARFAWQVKGKYHLKNETNDAAQPSAGRSSDRRDPNSSGSGSSNNNRESDQNLEALGGLNTKDSFLSASEQSYLTPSTENLSYPRYISSFEQSRFSNNILRSTSESSINDTNCAPLAASQNFTEDHCIARWQNRQMVAGYLDNTINSVLDVRVPPILLPQDEHSQYVALNVADFINNLPEDNSVENEGILMAISAHGLQQPASSNSCNEMYDNYINHVDCDTDYFNPLTPLPSDDDESQELENNNPQWENDSSNDLDISRLYSEDHKSDNNEVTTFPLFPDASSLSYQSVHDSHQNSSAEYDGIDSPMINRREFLDQAILLAIQNKGLTTFGSDYG